MQIIHQVAQLQEIVASLKQQQIGLVPTMGALHEGHLSLVKRSKKENDITFVSVFVNPTQFNDKKDLETYPRDLQKDAALLQQLEVDYVFAPSVEEIYPEPDTRKFAYPPITDVMEGSKRPGHFNGVCQIVSKLFYLIQPQKAYFGEKDFQQIAVVKAMVADLHLPVEICPCPIVREQSGLAKSSRNQLLSPEEKTIAAHIYQTLSESTDYATSHSVTQTIDYVTTTINAIQGLEVEYFKIVNANTLQDIQDWEDAPSIQGCITVYCGKHRIRLIDNINYK